MKGRGVPGSGGRRGDLLVTVEVVVPRKLTRTRRRMLEEYAATENGWGRAHLEEAVRSRGA